MVDNLLRFNVTLFLIIIIPIIFEDFCKCSNNEDYGIYINKYSFSFSIFITRFFQHDNRCDKSMICHTYFTLPSNFDSMNGK